MRLLEVLSSYSFNLYYMKGKDMILSDFLSRQIHDDSDPHEIILISFDMQNMLQTINKCRFLILFDNIYKLKFSITE